MLHVASLQEGGRGSFVIVICNPFCVGVQGIRCVESEDTLFEVGGYIVCRRIIYCQHMHDIRNFAYICPLVDDMSAHRIGIINSPKSVISA